MENNEQDKAFFLLIKKGVLLKKKYSKSSLHWIGKDEHSYYYSLSDDFKDRFLNYVFDIVYKNVKIHSEIYFSSIINRLNDFPDDIKDKKITLTIEKIQKQVSPHVLDTESENTMVLEYFNYVDYLKFYHNNFRVLQNESFKDHIKEKSLQQVIKLLKNEYSSKITIQGIKQEKKTSYVWQGRADKELPELYSLMTNKYSLVASETTLEQFTAIFTGQSIQSITPVKWHQDNASELLCFIYRLEQSKNIDNSERTDYQRMTACFVKPDGTKFKANWKQLKQNIDVNLSKNKQKTIDELVNNF